MSEMDKIVFKNLSHIDVYNKKENNSLSLIKKGEDYSVGISLLLCIFPKEDRIYRFFECFRSGYKLIAKEDRWRCADIVYSSIEEAIDDWNNTIMFDTVEQKWYNRPLCKFHFLDGSQYVKHFNTNEEMNDFLNDYVNFDWKIIENNDED